VSRSSAEKVGLLEGLLARVQRNAALPRTSVAVAAVTTIPEARPTTTHADDELEVVGEADEIAPISGEVVAAAAPPVAEIEVAHPTPSAGPAEVVAELHADDEVAPAAELEAVEELSPEDEVVAEEPAPEPLPLPIEPPVVARTEEPAPEPPPSEPPVLEVAEELHEEDEVPSSPKVEKRSDSIEIAVQTAAAAAVPLPAEPLEAVIKPAAPPDRPSDAQLGAIIELEEGPSAAIELAPSQPVIAAAPAEEEEVLPAAQSPGQFAPEMVHSSRSGAVAIPTPPPPAPPVEIEVAAVALAVPPSPAAAPVPVALAAPAAVSVAVEAQAITRQVLRGDVATFVTASRKPAATTFGELLDDALGL
jgi:hypothetical protein